MSCFRVVGAWVLLLFLFDVSLYSALVHFSTSILTPVTSPLSSEG